MAKRLTCCVAQVIADHFVRNEKAAKPGRKAPVKKAGDKGGKQKR